MGRPGVTGDDALMKMGLVLVVLGHVIFLLGALVHGIVLRHLSQSQQAYTMESNVAILLTGLAGIIAGVLIIILAKNRKSRTLMWFLLGSSMPGALLAAGSALGITVILGNVVTSGRHSLLLHCKLPDVADSPDIHGHCPFSPNRIYGTALALWLLLLVLSAVESVYLVRCCVASVSLLHLPCPPWAQRRTVITKQVSVMSPTEVMSDSGVRSHELKEEPLQHWEGSQEPKEEPLQHWEGPQELTEELTKNWEGPLQLNEEFRKNWVEPQKLKEKPRRHWAESASEDLLEPRMPLNRRVQLNRSSLWI